MNAFHPYPRANVPVALPAPSRSGLISLLLVGCLATILPAQAQLYTEHNQLFGESTSDKRFGLQVAANGDTVVVAAPGHVLDAPFDAAVFARGASGWALQQKMSFPTDGNVAVDGNTLVGGGAIYVRSAGTWSLQQTIANFMHPQAALQGDTLVIGNPHDPSQDRGGVYVYSRSGANWTQQAALGPDGADLHEMMGDTVALDGNTLIAGTGSYSGIGYSGPPRGGPYVYVRNGTTWTLQARLARPAGAGWSPVALEGDTAVVGDPNNGRVDIYTRAGTTWTIAQTLSLPSTGGSAYSFGRKISLKGGILGVGAGTMQYLYARTASGWTLAQSISRPGYTAESSLALANHGKLLVTGNPTDDTQSHDNGIVETFSVPPPAAPGGGWRDLDVGAVGVAGGSTVSGSQVAVRGSGADIWNAVDQFHFRTESMTGDGAIIARVDSIGAGNFWSKAGLMFREDIAPASRNVLALVTKGSPVGLQSRGATADTTNFVNAGWLGSPIWLMLARSGNLFAAYRSSDGSNWTPMGSATVSMPPTIHVGLAVTSHDNATFNTGAFSGIELVSTGTPPPPDTLTGSNLGTVTPPGTFSSTSGVVTIDAAGADIWNEADNGYFVNREISGDFDIRARITSLANTHAWAKAGLMVRESLAPQSRNVFTMLSAATAAGMQVRNTYGAATTFTVGPWVTAPYWVRLVRTGNNFQSLISQNGTTWQSIGTVSLALPATLRAGIGVSSHVANTTTRATVESLDLGH